MIERLTRERADGLALRGAGGEHQHRARMGQAPEGREDRALVVRGQVEQAVPGNQPVKPAQSGQGAHIGGDPALVREPRLRPRDHRAGAIDAGEAAAAADQVPGHRLTGAAAQVQDVPPARWQRLQERRQPVAFDQAPATPARKGRQMRLVERNDMGGGVTMRHIGILDIAGRAASRAKPPACSFAAQTGQDPLAVAGE